MSKKQKTKMAWIVSMGFVALMGAVSVGLFLTDNQPAQVETRTVPVQQVYSLEDLSMVTDEDLQEFSALDFSPLELRELAQDSEEVPEPTTLGILAIGGLAMLRRRNKRNK